VAERDKKPTELFDCEVRLGGNINHTVTLKGVSIYEISLLRAIHGEDSVPSRDMKSVGVKDIDSLDEMHRLSRKYANTSDAMSGKRLVERTFNTVLHGYENWLAETSELEEMEREEAQRKAQEAMRRPQPGTSSPETRERVAA
jgi:hypothetical protein